MKIRRVRDSKWLTRQVRKQILEEAKNAQKTPPTPCANDKHKRAQEEGEASDFQCCAWEDSKKMYNPSMDFIENSEKTPHERPRKTLVD